ncbi:PREDICTED: protein tramtrack, beta isoform-like [Wasmannia auropunctata]|uniref:protein tramtrack, beta isoform-like n=1 Tax=Wasmannia auropunctata TaxID=64793 RepID=UPI0005EFD460|nr:PREDICTED: protein tramtrack, beta isoform-like [Wasmannia auropunctata]
MLSFFDKLLYDETFADVTLVLDNNVMVKCHKIVLAACSTHFRTVFLNQPREHQTIMLKHIKYSELKPILEFMYSGKINVVEDQMGDMLKVAGAAACKHPHTRPDTTTSESSHPGFQSLYVCPDCVSSSSVSLPFIDNPFIDSYYCIPIAIVRPIRH